MDITRLPAEIAVAADRIRAHVRRTPLEYSPYFSEVCGARVWLKLENQQLTGSFKLRGAFNRLLTMSDAERKAGGVAASSGNHGAAIAYAMSKLAITGQIFVPEQSSPAKVEAIRRFGGKVEFAGTDGLETELYARAYAAERGMAYLSPYNDPAVVAGQGTCGLEISRGLNDIDAVYVAVGGGGLISGVGSILRAVNPQVSIVACQPAASAVMTESVKAGRVLELESQPTLSDGTAGGIEDGAITFDICRKITSEYLTVSEDEIADAMRAFIDAHQQLLEGAAGVALAGLLATAGKVKGKTVVVVICGGNISRDTLRRVIRESAA